MNPLMTAFCLLFGCLFAGTSFASSPTNSKDDFKSHGFESVRLFKPTKKSAADESVILFLAPRWLGGESTDIAKRFAREGHFVVWIDPLDFRLPSPHGGGTETRAKRTCSTFTDCLVALNATIQRRENFTEIRTPALLSIEDTARFAEAVWREAPEDSFSAILSIDHCPRDSRLPRGSTTQPTRWTILESPRQSGKCPSLTTAFLSLINVERAFLKSSPRLKSGPMIRWVNHRLREMKNVDTRLPASVATSKEMKIDDLLPVIIDPGLKGSYDSFVVLYSGDGGWAEFTDELASSLKELNIPVVGINSMRYFWKAKRPEKGAEDLERLIHHYQKLWSAKTYHVIGFSFGAGTLPFFLRRLSASTKEGLGTVALLSPQRKADFEFFISDWFFSEDRGVEVLPELRELRLSKAPICVFPADEKENSLCTQDSKPFSRAIELPGGHHFDGEIKKVVKAIFP